MSCVQQVDVVMTRGVMGGGRRLAGGAEGTARVCGWGCWGGMVQAPGVPGLELGRSGWSTMMGSWGSEVGRRWWGGGAVALDSAQTCVVQWPRMCGRSGSRRRLNSS
jgi:hypothetical protein